VDLLVTDVEMPGMNGQVLSEHARDARPDLPVLFISGNASHVLREAAGMASATNLSFLPKPFTPYEALRKVRQSLDDERSRRLRGSVSSWPASTNSPPHRG
jgi:CheY-like chemotaxis protein